jgi:hypothetical protein
MVLLLSALLVVRQYSACYPIHCGLSIGSYLETGRFVARHFLSWLPMLLLVTVADNATKQSDRGVRVWVFCAGVVLGAGAYALVFNFMQPRKLLEAMEGIRWVYFLMFFSRSLLYGGLVAGLLFYFTREREDARAQHESNLAKLSLDRQAIEARLQALQAQIEPHFLFNTLANIRLLYDADARQGKRLIHDLEGYLRAALPQMREARSTLGRELAMALAYLRILKVRMGARLKVAIDVPADLENARLPPMMLLTVVENAIKHGLNPRTDGGTIAIRAERRSAALRIVVADDGVGFQKTRGTGIGLANTRARLATLYGDAGRLALDANSEGGVSATIELPYEPASRETIR